MSTRTALAGVAALLATLTACAQPAPVTAPAGPPSATAAAEQVPEELRVRAPKDARGIPICEIIPRDQILALGYVPASARAEHGAPGDPVASCGWDRAAAPDTSGGITIRTDSPIPVMPGHYRLRTSYSTFEPTEVAGHPAVIERGTAAEPCTLTVAIADDQGLNTTGNYYAHGPNDSCDESRRLAEAVLANLPPRR